MSDSFQANVESRCNVMLLSRFLSPGVSTRVPVARDFLSLIHIICESKMDREPFSCTIKIS